MHFTFSYNTPQNLGRALTHAKAQELVFLESSTAFLKAQHILPRQQTRGETERKEMQTSGKNIKSQEEMKL